MSEDFDFENTGVPQSFKIFGEELDANTSKLKKELDSKNLIIARQNKTIENLIDEKTKLEEALKKSSFQTADRINLKPQKTPKEIIELFNSQQNRNYYPLYIWNTVKPKDQS